jgi:hypothetical protein
MRLQRDKNKIQTSTSQVKKKFIVTCFTLILTISSLGCLLFDRPLYYIVYVARYDTPFEIEKIEKALSENNIKIYEKKITELDPEKGTDESISLCFKFKDPGADDMKPSVDGWIGVYPGEKHYFACGNCSILQLSLDEFKYPRTKTREELNKYKPVLERSKNYIEGIIYNATGLWPSSSCYDVSGDVPV